MKDTDKTRPRDASRGSIGPGDVALGILVFHLISPRAAWAYLDPISGSIILQILAAGFLAAAATFRRSRNWLASFFSRLTKGSGS